MICDPLTSSLNAVVRLRRVDFTTDFLSFINAVNVKRLGSATSLPISNWTDALITAFKWPEATVRLRISIVSVLGALMLSARNISYEMRRNLVEEMFDMIHTAMKNRAYYDFRQIKHSLKMPTQELSIAFSREKSANCTLETPRVVCHGPGGRGFCLSSRGFKSGIVQWKVRVLKELKGNEATCIGISLRNPQDFSHRTTKDMWLYRAYSGHVYHDGELSDRQLPQFSQGDEVSVILNLNDRTLGFSKNDQVFRLAFGNLPEGMLKSDNSIFQRTLRFYESMQNIFSFY